MTANEVIARIDERKPNAFVRADKLQWLTEIESRAAREMFLCSLPRLITEETADAPLLFESPHDSVYLLWLGYQIDFENGEYGKAAAAVDRFNEAYREAVLEAARDYMPVYGVERQKAVLSDGEFASVFRVPPQCVVVRCILRSDGASGEIRLSDGDGVRLTSFDGSVTNETEPLYRTGAKERVLKLWRDQDNVTGSAVLSCVILRRGVPNDAEQLS